MSGERSLVACISLLLPQFLQLLGGDNPPSPTVMETNHGFRGGGEAEAELEGDWNTDARWWIFFRLGDSSTLLQPKQNCEAGFFFLSEPRRCERKKITGPGTSDIQPRDHSEIYSILFLSGKPLNCLYPGRHGTQGGKGSGEYWERELTVVTFFFVFSNVV